MVITLKPGTTEKGIQHVLDKIKELGFTPHVSKGAERTIIGVIGENAIDIKNDQFDFSQSVSQIFHIIILYRVTNLLSGWDLVNRKE